MTSLFDKYQRKIDDQQKIQQACEDEMISIEGQIRSLRDRLADLKYEARKAVEAQNDLGKKRNKALDAKCRRNIKKLCEKYSLTSERTELES